MTETSSSYFLLYMGSSPVALHLKPLSDRYVETSPRIINIECLRAGDLGIMPFKRDPLTALFMLTSILDVSLVGPLWGGVGAPFSLSSSVSFPIIGGTQASEFHRSQRLL